MNNFIMSIAGYDIIEEIQSSVNSTIYRAASAGTNKGAIVKLLKAEYPTLEEITRLKHEYQILQHLENLEGIVKPYSLENHKNAFALILEDFGGEFLKNYIISKNIELSEFLKIASQIASTLSEVHKKHVIHKDIKPHNILINPKTGEVKLADFSIASRLERENQALSNPNFLEGTLAYMSPEQTGRMNRSIDYRTDLYSLGVTLYEMLTGVLPCTNTEPLELVYCHIAQKIVPPQALNSEILPAISDIVMKLLAKNAEDRYQSAEGLKFDLETCLVKLQDTGSIDEFVAGSADKASQLNIPQKLYGREPEVKKLLETFDRVASPPENRVANGTTELMLVSGYSGIGKTVLVNEVHKPIVRQRGYFIAGKFDQFKRNIPYASLIQAFQSLILQLLTEGEAEIKIWKENLLAALSINGQIIVDVIPEVELIIGKQPPVPELGATESQNRFSQVFKQFIGVFTTQEHPLVVFLDDLQWADSASLKLIELLMTDSDSKYLLLIGAYRDNEVSPTHPTIQTIEKIQQAGATVNNIELGPLQIVHVEELIADTLNESVQSKLLAELLLNKTQGNPFFLTQLLKTLYQEKLLSYELSLGAWQWDTKQIQALGITDLNVVELVARNIRKLSPDTQKVLTLAACIGNTFNLDVLAIVNEESSSIAAAQLWSALQTGLILPLSNEYKIPLVFSQEEAGGFTLTDVKVDYKFLHDRVQQAAYSLIPDDEKKQTHLKIGQLLLQNTTPEERKENIFALVNQLNYGTDLLATDSEKYELASLNLIAGQKAKAATAYESAVKYLNVGLGLLGSDSWESQYDLTLNLYLEAAEAEYLNTQFERSQQLSDVILKQAKTLLEKVKVYEIKIQIELSVNRINSVINTGMEVLEMLDVRLEQEPPQELMIDNLANLPLMTDPDKIAAMRILMSILPAAYLANPDLLQLILFTMITLSIAYGNSPESAYAYVWYGALLCGAMGDIESGYRFGKLALPLLEKFDANTLKAKLICIFYVLIHPCKCPVKENEEPFIDGIQSSLEVGDIEYACHHAMSFCYFRFFSGQELGKVELSQAKYAAMTSKYKQGYNLGGVKIYQQLVNNFLGKAPNKLHLIGDSFNEEEMIPVIKEANNNTLLFFYYVAKTILLYSFKDYEGTVANANLSSEYGSFGVGTIQNAIYNFYYSLALLALYPKAQLKEKEEYLRQVAANQEKMKTWAFHAPCNFQHKYDLVEAEKARVLGQNEKAMNDYDRAITGAAKQEYIQEEALANELAAEFYFSRGKKAIAEVYLTESYHGYIRWGATAKVQDLEERYPQLLSEKPDREAAKLEVSKTSSSNNTGLSHLDLTTVMKASQALAGEIVLDKLLSKLMLIVRENAGAQKGCLILEKDGELFVEATITDEGDEVNVLQSIPVYVGASLANNLEVKQITPLQNPPSSNLPLSLINYVTRTRENLVLNDANAEPRFNTDPYIATHQPKSLLCTPLIHQGKLVGLLYLENNLTQGAFTSDRLEILRLLSSQAAISLENARLYTNLETAKNQLQDYSKTLEVKVEERTLELKEKNDNLQQEIRDRLLAEEALRLSEERFRAIFESTDDFIAVWDRNYHCLYANQAWLDNIQKPRDRVIGKQFSEILKDSPELIPLWTSRFETIFNTCKSLYVEDATNVGDLPSYSESTLSPIKDSTGKVFAVGVVYRDITERKLAEAALRDSEARLRQQAIELQEALDELRRTQIQLIQNEKMASLGQLVGGVAHEINNPASFIYGNLSHAKEYIQSLFQILHLYQQHYPEPDPEIQEQAEENEIDFIVEDLPKLLESMQMGVKRIRSIVLSLRNFSRLDESDMKRVDIHEGIESTLLILQNRLNKNDGTPAIEVIKKYGTLPEIECYVGHLNQVLMNILTNAIDALEEGKKGLESSQSPVPSPQSPIPTICIRTEMIESDKIAVRIADNGSGITEEIQQNIFDPFFTTKPVGKGTGLGLSISYKIVVEKHGGNLRCISSPGNGAEFIIEIPLRQLIKT